MAEDRHQRVPRTPYDVFCIIRESYQFAALTGDSDTAQRHQADAMVAMVEAMGEEEAVLTWGSGMGLWADHNREGSENNG